MCMRIRFRLVECVIKGHAWEFCSVREVTFVQSGLEARSVVTYFVSESFR